MARRRTLWAGSMLAVLGILGMGARGAAPERFPLGVHTMTQQQLTDALAQIAPEPNPKLDALARDLVQQSRAPARDAIKLLRDPDQKTAQKAVTLLSQMGDLTTQPLLDTPDSPDPKQRVWMMRNIAQNLIDQRAAVHARLTRLLTDKTNVPLPPQTPDVEEEEQPFRVCDEAYLQLRRLDDTGEEEDQFYLNARYFLNASNADKDAEIRRATTTNVWKRYIEP